MSNLSQVGKDKQQELGLQENPFGAKIETVAQLQHLCKGILGPGCFVSKLTRKDRYIIYLEKFQQYFVGRWCFESFAKLKPNQPTYPKITTKNHPKKMTNGTQADGLPKIEALQEDPNEEV